MCLKHILQGKWGAVEIPGREGEEGAVCSCSPGEHQVLGHFLGHVMWCFLSPHPSSALTGRGVSEPLSSPLGGDGFAWERKVGRGPALSSPLPPSASSLLGPIC